MITAKLNLYILIFNKHKLNHDILSIEENFLKTPSVIINDNDESLEQVSSSLFESYVDLSGSFVRYKLCDASLVNKILVLSYFCVVPFGTKIKNSFLVSSQDYANYTKTLPNILRLL